MDKKAYVVFLFAVLGAIIIYYFAFEIPSSAKMVLSITFLALVLWISEALPLHITALLVGVLLIIFGKFDSALVFASYFDKVVVLVLGGFALAVALRKHQLDDYLSQKLLGKLGKTPNLMILAVLSVTAALSMWISNSATAALAMPIVLFILKQNKRLPGKSLFGKAMVISVAYGATIGGMGMLIGSTPNVLAQKFLTHEGIPFGFLEWGTRGFPFTVLMVLITWIILMHVFKPEITRIKMHTHPHPFTREQKIVGLIFLFTVLLWITESIHGIHNSVVALFPIILLSLFRLIEPKDFKEMGWDSLILIGGGIALGTAIDASGLSAILATNLGGTLFNQSLFFVFLILGIVGVALTSFISNTAASAVLVPIVTSLAGVLNVDITNLVVAGALGVSLDFIFPMGTPPTAIAYSTQYIKMKDIIKSGILVSIAGILVLAILAFFTW